MLIRKPWFNVLYIVIGVIMAFGYASLFLDDRTAWHAIMSLVGVIWIWLGVSRLWQLRKAAPKQ